MHYNSDMLAASYHWIEQLTDTSKVHAWTVKL